MLKGREPSNTELGELNSLCWEEDGDDSRMSCISGICVFDKYMTDCPGYTGKVMLVLYSGAPEFVQLFVWEAVSDAAGNTGTKMVRREIE